MPSSRPRPRRRSRLPLLSLLAAAGLAGCNADLDGGGDPSQAMTPAMTPEPPKSLDDLLRSACATGTAPTDRVPVYMLFILDGSGSMRQQGKWEAATAALTAIFDDFAGQASPS